MERETIHEIAEKMYSEYKVLVEQIGIPEADRVKVYDIEVQLDELMNKVADVYTVIGSFNLD